MEGKDKRDVDADVFLHVLQEDSQPTESDIDQYTVLSTVSATVPVPANNPTCCTYDYNISHILKCELPENRKRTVYTTKRYIVLMVSMYLVGKVSSVRNKDNNSTSNNLSFH